MDEGSSPSSGRIVRRRVRSKLDGGSRALLRQSSDEDGNDKSLHLTGDDRARLDELESSFAEKDASTQDVRQIDAELEYLDAIALRLRARRNACQAISRLPTEMVTEIIYFVAAASPPHRPFLRVHDRGVVADAGRTRSDLGWIRLAHVSRRWRSIVLQLSMLWARSVCSLIGAEEVILARARSVPLTLRLNAHHHRIDSQTVEFAQKYIHRAREIEMREVLLHPHTAVWPSGPRALAGRDFPLLESLCLDLKPSRNPPIMHDVFSLAPLRAPRLKRLELTNIFVPWAPAPNLTELILSRCDFQNLAVVPPPELLLSLLGSCPQLRKLHLLGWIPDLPVLPVGENLNNAADPLDRIICLPHIEELSLTTSTRRMIAFWSRIRVPSTADVRLRLDPAHLDLTLHHPRHDPERLELVRAIGPHFASALLPDAPRRIIGASIFDFPDEESLRFCLFTREPGQENAGQEAHWTGPFARDYGLRLDIQCYRWQMSAQNFVEMLDCVFDSFDFGRLETFEVMSHHRGHTNEWQRTLARVSSPEIISLDGMPNKDILDAIGSSLPQQVPVTSASTTEADADAASPAAASSGPSPVLFPNMRTLFLSASTEREWLADVDAQTDVIDMLQYRLDMGAPIEHLILDEIALSPVQVEADQLLRCLRQVVERVEVKKDKSAPRVSPGFLPWQGSLLIPMPQVITTPGAAGLIL